MGANYTSANYRGANYEGANYASANYTSANLEYNRFEILEILKIHMKRVYEIKMSYQIKNNYISYLKNSQQIV